MYVPRVELDTVQVQFSILWAILRYDYNDYNNYNKKGSDHSGLLSTFLLRRVGSSVFPSSHRIPGDDSECPCPHLPPPIPLLYHGEERCGSGCGCGCGCGISEGVDWHGVIVIVGVVLRGCVKICRCRCRCRCHYHWYLLLPE